MMWKWKTIGFSLWFLIVPCVVQAETIKGIVKSVHPSGRSFSVEVPPVIRVYLSGSSGGQKVKPGDYVEVEGQTQPNGVFAAKSFQVTQGKIPSHDLLTHQIPITLGQEFFLGVAQTALLQDGNKTLKIFGKNFINTLCQEGYDCSHEGVVGMFLEISSGGKKKEIELVSQNTRKPIQPVLIKVFGYTIFLNECGEDIVSLTVH